MLRKTGTRSCQLCVVSSIWARLCHAGSSFLLYFTALRNSISARAVIVRGKKLLAVFVVALGAFLR